MAVVASAFLTFATSGLHADDPRTDSWLTEYSGKYGRIYENAAAQSSGSAVATWGNGSQNQTLPAYAGVQEILSSSDWVYLRTTGLGIHTMGPWPANFPNLPKNQKVLYRIPRVPTVPVEKTLTGLGAIGYFVDGVAMFDSRDAFYWTGSTETQGSGMWNREAYVNEGATFDPAKAHQENSGTYHYHANPIALRYLLGDHVDYDAKAKTYSEVSSGIIQHSPILGWVRDGFPVYGPYGYASASNSASGIRRMASGYQLRNGQKNTDDLTANGRTSLPKWAQRLYHADSTAVVGPNVSATYPLGRYMEDNAYLGDLGYQQGVDFDLDEYNGRWCVTPEFPGGTYAYFVAINADGTPAFPYNIGRAFYGAPSGAAISAIGENVVIHFVGGPDADVTLKAPAVNSGALELVWSAAEGGTYRVESALALGSSGAWTVLSSNFVATGPTGGLKTAAEAGKAFFRVARTGLADFDGVTNAAGANTGGGGGSGVVSVSPTHAARGSSFTLIVNLDAGAQPPPPPQNAPIRSVTIGTVTGSGNVHVSQTQVTSTITIPVSTPPGLQTVTVVFPGPPGNTAQTLSYSLTDGFTID